jgi:putative two-component system response regulator
MPGSKEGSHMNQEEINMAKSEKTAEAAVENTGIEKEIEAKQTGIEIEAGHEAPVEDRNKNKQDQERGRKTILAVDDIVTVLTMIRKILDNTYEVCLAKSAEIALTILNSNKVDLILLDIDMPEMSGFDFLSSLRENPRFTDIPVIFVTAHATRDFIVQANKAGAKDFVVKPVTPTILLAKINAVLEEEATGGKYLLIKKLVALSNACRKGISSSANTLAGELKGIHFNARTDTCLAEIFRFITRLDYPIAAKKIQLLLDNNFYEDT